MNIPSSRKPDQEIRDREEQRRILQDAEVGYLGLSSPDGPYVVPVNFALDGDRILIHSALEGTKMEILQQDPRVCFTAVSEAAYLEGQGNYSYRSVLVFGTVELLEDIEAKRRAYLRLLAKYDPSIADMITQACLEGSAILAIRMRAVTGKKGSQDP